MTEIPFRWIDFHCHLDLYPDHETLIEEADRHAIATLAVTTTPKAWPRNRELALGARSVRVGLGFHPQIVADRPGDWPLFERYFPDAKYIGEVGLDAGPAHYRSLDKQEEIFVRILAMCARHGGKILSVHSVRSVGRVLALLKRELPLGGSRVVLHWFTGSIAEAQRAAALGCYFSINSAMVQSQRGRDLILALPRDRLLTETDGPFVREGDQPMRPRQVMHTVTRMATILGISQEELAAALIGNLSRLIGSAEF